ncbi:hypothetical protein [Shewanella sairae]|nr:hypothetical protein [Shewanella sairae]MCL1130483.1 hypothetical protein [Shewanella sairae]
MRHACKMLAAIWLSILPYTASAIPSLYVDIANEHNIPAKVLYGLALTESQKKLTNGSVRPWPWTLNVKGKAYFYPNSHQACQALTGFLRQTQIVDIGLTQQNWRYQGGHFDSPCEVLEPKANLTHAARLLNQGYRVHGTWLGAAGWFHRPAGGDIAERYKTNFVNNYRAIRYE